MARRAEDGQQGFIITLELVLIFTILGIGLLVGIVAIRNALFVWWQNKKSYTVWVYDSAVDGTGAAAPNVMGPVRDFDEHEAPRFFFIDRDVSWCWAASDPNCTPVEQNFRAFIGVRDDRFTTRHRIFYENAGCTGPAICIQAAGSESPDSRNVGVVVNEATPGSPVPTEQYLDGAGGVGYLYALQQGPSYGIGRDPDTVGNPSGLPGALYRQTPDYCDAETTLSVWESQRVGGACVERTVSILVDEKNCQPTPAGCPGGADPECIDTGNSCDCPDGWFRPTGGANCCPLGSSEVPGQCRFASFYNAEPVPVFNEVDWTTPFRVNLPPDPSQFFLITPSGTEGVPGTVTNVPYDPSQPIDFDVAPATGEGGSPP